MSAPDIGAVLHRVRDALEGLGRSYALVGGLAVSVHTEPRFTRDADFVVVVQDDHDAEELIRALRRNALVPFALVEQQATGRLATARLRDPAGGVCDLLFANTGIEDEIVRSATRLEVLDAFELPVASPELLVAMKVLLASPSRPQDSQDLLALWTRGIDDELVVGALRRIEAAGCHRQQDLVGKLRELRAGVGFTGD